MSLSKGIFLSLHERAQTLVQKQCHDGRHRHSLRQHVSKLISGGDPLNANGGSLLEVLSDQQINERLPFTRRAAVLVQMIVQALRVRDERARNAEPVPPALCTVGLTMQKCFQQRACVELPVQSSGQ